MYTIQVLSVSCSSVDNMFVAALTICYLLCMLGLTKHDSFVDHVYPQVRYDVVLSALTIEMLSRSRLLASSVAFCDAFAQKKDLDIIVSHFSTTHQVSVVEHGEKSLAPFLGKSFRGLDGARSYFETIASSLSYEDMEFSEFIVDAEAKRAACKGRARFTWNETGESWDETFAYMLDFDDEGKITDYQVWADSGAAYLARKGELDKVRRG
ncbi:hypothetical protein BT96DRAFT_418858 [Gymnopus androsaceus JB14]|uniref:SnoaL-like domain-containing protein n=1 Tax=Gymnopus androsaceus JB14 TaxID=1447944 RepID=A0A6A4I3F5_9AGAR|nr:hypothetical protein BT96DRAFT_418858 [Gymnopus androsaceus JB14]